MQTKVMTFLLSLALIRTQLWHVRVCLCVLLCLVASGCLDQLSVWYLDGSNFRQCILVMGSPQKHLLTVGWLKKTRSVGISGCSIQRNVLICFDGAVLRE